MHRIYYTYCYLCFFRKAFSVIYDIFILRKKFKRTKVLPNNHTRSLFLALGPFFSDGLSRLHSQIALRQPFFIGLNTETSAR